MNALFIYLLQMMAASGLLYGYYHLALRNNQFHQYNRFYLLSVTVISIIIPFLNIPYYFTAEEKHASLVLQTLTVISPVSSGETAAPAFTPAVSHSGISVSTLLVYIYLFIAAVVLFRVIVSLLRIRKIARQYPAEQLGNIRFINTREPGTPFSFFRWLFWNREIDLHSEKGEQVFRHELFHIEQKHSLDIVYAELLTAVCWFNPFFHLIKKELRAIHEFLADQFAITENKKWQYAEMLLMQALQTNQSLVNPFFNSHIKRRIAMITLSKRPGYRYARKMLVLPVTALAFILFAFSYHEKKPEVVPGTIEKAAAADTTGKPEKAGMSLWQKTENSTVVKSNHLWVSPLKSKRKVEFEQKLLVLNGEIMPIQSIYKKQIKADSIFVYGPDDADAITLYGDKARNGLLIFKNAVLADAVTMAGNKEADKIFDRVEKEPSFRGGDTAWRNFIVKNLKAGIPAEQHAPPGDYTVIVMFVVDKNGSLSDFKALTNFGYGMEQEAIRVMQLSPAWNPAQQNGKLVKYYFKQPVTFRVVKNNNSHAVTDLPANDNMIFSKVEIEPSFPGGEAKFREYTALYQKNNHDKLSRASFTDAIAVDFLVKTDGTVSDIKVAPGTDATAYADAAVELIRNGPKWIPAVQNGRQVNAMKRQVIVFSSVPGKIPTTAQWVKATGVKVPKLSVSEFKLATVYQLLQLENGTEITGYQLTIDNNEGRVKQIFNKGAYFNSASKDLIRGAYAGNFIQFDQLIIKADGAVKKMPSIVYELVN